MSQPPKKGPRMTRLFSHEGKMQEDLELLEVEAELNASADTVLGIIEDSRGRMTDAERETADQKADAILKRATESARLSRRRA
jgi:hypothetical protein